MEMGRENRDAYGDRETYNTITLECVHLILQFEYKCSSNDLSIIKERCTYKRWNTKTNTKKHTCDLNVRIKRVHADPKVFQRNKCAMVKHHQGVKEGPQLGGESLHAHVHGGLEGHSSYNSLLLTATWDCSNFSTICFHFAFLAPVFRSIGPYEGQGHGITLTSSPDHRESICHASSMLNPSTF